MAEYTYADVIIDPEDPRVEIGEKYYKSDNPKKVLGYANDNNATLLGTLENIDEYSETPFIVRAGVFSSSWACLIRKKEPEKKYVPFDLSDSEVRKSLRGKWIKNKDNHFEICITDFSHQGHVGNTIRADIYRANGMEADELLNYWMFDDGTPCGNLVEE